MKRFAILGLVMTFLFAPFVTSAQDDAPTDIPEGAENATVTSYVDGEKFKARIDGEEKEIRLIGVDAPEVAKDDKNGECFAQEATDFLAETIPVDSEVFLVKDSEDKDDKDRLWRYVWIPSDEEGKGTLLNALVLREGYGVPREEEKNTTYNDLFESSQEAAEEEGVGLWSECGGPHIEITPVPEHGSKGDPGTVGETLVAESVDVTITDAYFTYDYNYSTPKGGYVFLILEVELRNNGEDTKNYESRRWEARDVASDAKYEETFVLLDSPLGSGDLSTGEFVSGQVALEVQDVEGAEYRVQYQISSFGDNFVYWIVPR